MKNYKFTIRGHKYEVDIKSFEDNIAEIEVNGTAYQVEVHKEIKKAAKTPTLVRQRLPEPARKEQKLKKTINTSKYIVKAPLPGSILKLLINVGDTIKKGDKLLIMEAMKMENDVLSEKDGVVKSIAIKEGDSVLQNDILIEIN